MKKVTVALNVYNGMPYLPEAVDSVLRQTLVDFDLLVVNDGSTDGSRDYLASLSDPRLRIVEQENAGCSTASNRAIELCQTEFLARMDADDVAHPERLQTQLDFLERHSEVGLLGTQTACLGDQSIGRSIKLPCTHDEIWQTLNRGLHAMAHPTLMMRTALVRQIGGYWSHRLADDDVDLMLRMGEIAQLANVDRPLLHYRVRNTSISGVDVRGMCFSCDFAIELGRRRRAGLPPISPEEFRAALEARPWLERALDSLEIHARTQYRLATEQMLSGRPLAGRARLAWAAFCSPKLTVQRLRRILRRSEAGACDATIQSNSSQHLPGSTS